MNSEKLLVSLEQINFFEGYTEASRVSAINHIKKEKFLKQAQKEESEELVSHIAQWPGAFLFTANVDLEWDDNLSGFIRLVARNSFGLFKPKKVSIRSVSGGDLVRMQIATNQTTYSEELYDYNGWISEELIFFLTEVVESCTGINLYFWGDGESQTIRWIFAKKEQMKHMIKLGLLPEPDYQTNDADSALALLRQRSDIAELKFKSRSIPINRDLQTCSVIVGFSGERIVLFRYLFWYDNELAKKADRISMGLPVFMGTDVVFGEDLLAPQYYHTWIASGHLLKAAHNLELIEYESSRIAKFNNYGQMIYHKNRNERLLKSEDKKEFEATEQWLKDKIVEEMTENLYHMCWLPENGASEQIFQLPV